MRQRILVAAAVALCAAGAFAQQALTLPPSGGNQRQTIIQEIGPVKVTVDYSSPHVHSPQGQDRRGKIWGELVPYGLVNLGFGTCKECPWRAGANENTTISFSTPVKIEGQPLPAGTYALYAIPTASQWTIIFSKFTGDWGVYNYDESEDALRVKVTPQAVADSQERLLYTFDDVTNNSVVAALRWEKLRVPIKIEVDLTSTVRASIESALRGGKHWDANAWIAAARWELRNGDADRALKDIDHSLSLTVTAPALRTKAAILDKKGDAKTAAELRERAKSMFSEAETIALGYGTLLNAKKYDDAIAFLNNYATAHPQSPEMWRIYAGLGDSYSAKGDHAKAKEYFDKALAAAHDTSEKTEVWDSINAAAATPAS